MHALTCPPPPALSSLHSLTYSLCLLVLSPYAPSSLPPLHHAACTDSVLNWRCWYHAWAQEEATPNGTVKLVRGCVRM